MRRPVASSGLKADPFVSYLLELRVRMRGDAESQALIDRALQLLSQIEGAIDDERPALDRELRGLTDEINLRFGPPTTATVQ